VGNGDKRREEEEGVRGERKRSVELGNEGEYHAFEFCQLRARKEYERPLAPLVGVVMHIQ